MPAFADLINQGAAHAWLFVPTAVLLGALHGLEPGHSKTMMAAFIVAIRGTVGQAILLGLAATISHTVIVWAIALSGLYLWSGVDSTRVEPYLQVVSAVMIVAIALWMIRRVHRDQLQSRAAAHHHHHDHPHGHGPSGDRGHGRHDDVRRIDTGHGVLALEIFETGVPPRWRIRSETGHGWRAEDVTIETERPDGRRQEFRFVARDGRLESLEEIPEPHEFVARLRLAHGHHSHDYDVNFVEGEGHDHIHEELRGLNLATAGYQDAHELAHANDIRRRFADRNVTTGQVILFGLTGGLIPCPASITVLLLCLQLRQFTMGAALVLCFSVGLALTLVAVGVIAALSVQHVTRRVSWFSTVAQRAPYLSSLLVVAVGFYVGIEGWMGLAALR